MRPWFWVAAALVVAVAADDNYDAAKRVFATWSRQSPINTIEEEILHSRTSFQSPNEYFDDSIHARAKRSLEQNAVPLPHSNLASFIGPDKSCQTPGYTGEFCEFPICSEQNTAVPDDPDITGFGSSVEAVALANCTTKYVTLIDETMTFIRIELEAGGPSNPRFYVQTEDGSIVFPDFVQDDQYQSVRTFENLPPGRLLIGPSADVSTEHCNLFVRARTPVTVAAGFMSGEGQQVERNDFPHLKNAYKGLPTAIVMHANRVNSPGKIIAANIIGQNNSIFRPRLVQTRYNCSYEFFIEDYYCNSNSLSGDMLLQVEGVTFAGFGFRRIIAFKCISTSTTSSPGGSTGSTAAPPQACQNNGILVQQALGGSSYCYCLGLWTGSDCSQPLCDNGGTPKSDNTGCTCQDGFRGNHCETIYCADSGVWGFDATQPTLTLVIRARTQMKPIIDQVSQVIANYMNTLTFDPAYLQRFILVLFNNKQNLLEQQYTDYTAMLADLSLYTAAGNLTSDGGCTDNVYSAISSALQKYATQKSPVYVITDAIAQDFDQSENAFALASQFRVTMNIIVVQPEYGGTCDIVPGANGYVSLNMFSRAAGGLLFYIPNTSRDNVATLLASHMSSTVYRSQLMLANDYTVCGNQEVFKTVSVDYTTQQFSIVATGPKLYISMNNPSGKLVSPTNVYQDGANYIWTYNLPYSGNWMFSFSTLTTSEPCSFQVYHKSYDSQPAFYNQYDIFWAFSPTIANDGNLPQPVLGFEAAPVLYITDYPDVSSDTVSATLSIYAERDLFSTPVYLSNGIYRSGCSFNFYFPPFTCQNEETLHFTFVVRDEHGMAIQRAGAMQCFMVHPTTSPTDHVCKNGGVINPMNTTCFCPLGYTGTYCQQLDCQNGGTPNGESCSCPLGSGGTFCEFATCINQAPQPEFMMEGVDMVFAVEVTQIGIAQVATLNTYFANLVRDIQSQHPYWIERFVLVGFNSTWGDVIVESDPFDPSKVVQALKDLSATLPTDPGCNNVQLYRGLDRAIRERDARPGSFIEIFITSAPDDSTEYAWDLLYDFTRSLNLRITGFISVNQRYSNASNPNGYMCPNVNDTNYNFLGMVSTSSLGELYLSQPAYASALSRVIPNQYWSSTVYARYQADCYTQPMQVFFPVDAHTQTVQIETYAQGSTMQLFDDTGLQYDLLSLVKDDFTGLNIGEYRRPCDEGYQRVGQACIEFVIQPLSWRAAHYYCWLNNAYLVDDMSSDKHAYLTSSAHGQKFWLGLYGNASNGYLWDRAQNVAPSPLIQDQQYWSDGSNTPPPYNANKSCVFWDGPASSGNTWSLDSCETLRTFACQKHNFDYQYTTTSVGDELIKPGKYYVTVTATQNTDLPVPSNQCFTRVRVQSRLLLISGFTTLTTQDWPELDPVARATTNRLVAYVHDEGEKERTPVLTHGALFDAYTGAFKDTVRYNYRLGCSFQWVSQTFACPDTDSDNNEFTIIHGGEDEFGNAFQRVSWGHCARPQITCGNGGVLYNGKCVCTEYWTGQDCTVPICVNDGKLLPDDNTCACNTGWTGPNCQYDLCNSQNPISTLTPDSKTLILVVEATLQTKATVDDLATNIGSVVSAAQAVGPNWFKNFALVTFDSSGVKYQNFGFTSIQDVAAQLVTISSQITDAGACNLPLFGVLGAILRPNRAQITAPYSTMYVFTAASASDHDMWMPAVEQINTMQLIWNQVQISTTTCGTVPTEPNYDRLVGVVYQSLGSVLFSSPSAVSQLLTTYMPTRYASVVMGNPTYHLGMQCPGDDFYVQIDRNATFIYVVTYSQLGQLTVMNPAAEMMTPQPLYQENLPSGAITATNFVYKVSTSNTPGIWKFGLTSPGSCFMSVYTDSPVKMYTMFAQTTMLDPWGAHLDGYQATPVPNFSNIAAFRLDGSRGHRARLTYMIALDGGNGSLIARSRLYERFQCTFDYFSEPFHCNTEAIMLMVYGIDEYNIPFRRFEPSFCWDGGNIQTTTAAAVTTLPSSSTLPSATTSPSATMPPSSTTTPIPTTSYSNKNLIFDLVFMVDVSSTAKDLLNDMTSFIKQFSQAFTIAQTNVRVAVITVAGLDGMNLAVSQLNTYSSNSNFENSLSSIASYDDFADQGQYLQSSLNIAINPNFLSAGYRTSIQNHLIIYLTTNSAFSDSPDTTTIASNYQLMAVGYGSQANVFDLRNITPSSCAFAATNAQDLNAFIPLIQQAVFNADSTGNYCP